MTYAILKDGAEVATVTAENLEFGRRVKPGSMLETEMVEDKTLLKQKDAQGNVTFIVAMAKGYTAEVKA